MREKQTGKGKDWKHMMIAMGVGILVNLLLSFGCYMLGLPLYLDTIGTISVAAMGGAFAGIVTGVASSLLCTLFNEYAVYYTLIQVLIAGATTIFMWSGKQKNRGITFLYLMFITGFGGVLGTVFQWVLLGGPQFTSVAEASAGISAQTGLSVFASSILVSTGLNFVDKGITAGFASFIYYAVPDTLKTSIWNGGWRQTPLSRENIKELEDMSRGQRKSMQRRMSLLITFASAAVALAMGWISIKIYYDNSRKEYTGKAESAAKFAATVVDPNMIDEYLRKGESTKGYKETEDLLYRIKENAGGIEYLYFVRIERDGIYYIFDLDTEKVKGYECGEKTEFEPAFEPYRTELINGEEIPPIESKGIFGWILSVYIPVKDAYGRTVCYSCADVSMHFFSGYVLNFLLKTLFIFSGFFFLILAYGLWISRYCIIFPISSMTAHTVGFIKHSDDTKELDRKVREIKTLKINTGDEVEALYTSICEMAEGMAEEMKAVRYYAKATAQMQNGLIITMADMVENRDSDTGAHVQKTAAYVKIILDGLKRKGYYLEKLTEKFMTDVEMSAPLHDVGKINISDTILNKPGKLDEKEYEIMKTHTTAGKEILEKAISKVKGENYLKEARNMAAYHHERWDGKGYPEGLKGEVIPLSARIMAVADVFDALSSPRVYKPAFPFEKAISIIEEGSGSQFDPKCVEAFMDSLKEVKLVLKKYHD